MIIKRKLFSKGLEQKEFNSKSTKAFRRTYDLAKGLLSPKVSSPGAVKKSINEIIHEGRRINKFDDVSGKTIHSAINDRAGYSWNSGASIKKLYRPGTSKKVINERYDHGTNFENNPLLTSYKRGSVKNSLQRRHKN